MDRALATALIHPLAPGGATESGWALQSIEIERSEHVSGYRRAVYVFSSPPLSLVLRPVGYGGNAAAESRNFVVSIRDDDGVFQSVGEAGFRDFVGLVQSNDTSDYDLAGSMNASIAEVEVHGEGGGTTVFVVPGHIGSLYDLSFRAIRILQDVPVILTEAGNDLDLELIDRHFQIGLEGKTVFEFDKIGEPELQRLTDLLETGGDLCLFGAGEGLPTVCDPGWKAIEFFQEREVRICTVAGGGALAAALMRRGNDRPFSFWGVLGRDDGNPVIGHLVAAAARDERFLPTPICFAHVESLVEAWPELLQALVGYDGRIRFMSDLTRVGEGEIAVDVVDLHSFDPRSLGDGTKLVILFEVQLLEGTAIGRLWRWLKRPWSALR